MVENFNGRFRHVPADQKAINQVGKLVIYFGDVLEIIIGRKDKVTIQLDPAQRFPGGLLRK